MPLEIGKSGKLVKENVQRELDSGGPQKQAIAIAMAAKKKSGQGLIK